MIAIAIAVVMMIEYAKKIYYSKFYLYKIAHVKDKTSSVIQITSVYFYFSYSIVNEYHSRNLCNYIQIDWIELIATVIEKLTIDGVSHCNPRDSLSRIVHSCADIPYQTKYFYMNVSL